MITASRVHATELISRAKELGLFPETAQRIQDVARRPGSSDSDLARAIQMDPIATARMLKLMNSSFYGLNRRVADLRQAITLMGFRSARDLAIALVLGQKITALSPTTRAVWAHSVRTGCALHLLARYSRAIRPADALVCGLVHDIGLIAMCVLEPDFSKVYETLNGEGNPMLKNAERLYFGVSHAELGAMLLNAWGIPANVADAVSQHHHPLHESPTAALLNAAEYLAADATPTLEALVEHPAFIATKLTERQISISREVYLEEVNHMAKSLG